VKDTNNPWPGNNMLFTATFKNLSGCVNCFVPTDLVLTFIGDTNPSDSPLELDPNQCQAVAQEIAPHGPPAVDYVWTFKTSFASGGLYVGVAVGVAVRVTVNVGLLVTVRVKVCVAVGVQVGVGLDVNVAVSVAVGVSVGVQVGVAVGVQVGVPVGVQVGVPVGVQVGVAVGVQVGVADCVLVGVKVEVNATPKPRLTRFEVDDAPHSKQEKEY